MYSVSLPAIGVVLSFDGMSSVAQAQQSTAMTAVYGRGVHAYFAGNTPVADQYFTQVIQAGSTDPRPYYFRAMLRLQQGNQYAAENDMRIGATFEARNPGTQHSIGIALQRVQGPGRRTLEKYRRLARLDRLQQRHQQTQQRYEQLNQRAPTVIRQVHPLPLGQPVQPPTGIVAPGPAIAPAPEMAAPHMESPVPALAAPQPVEPTLTPSVPATPTQDDPFGSDVDNSDSSPAPAEVDPFGESEAPADLNEDNPFGESTDTADSADEPDPFGESVSEEPAADEPSEEPVDEATTDDDDPFGDSAPAEDDDPFGESSSTESEPAEEEPAPVDNSDAPSDDSSEPDSEPAEDDDPFGDFGATAPQQGNDSFDEQFAQPGSVQNSGPAVAPNQIFFALGHWLGSKSNPSANSGGLTQATFELGPAADGQAAEATEGQAFDDDPFGAEPESMESVEDPFGEEDAAVDTKASPEAETSDDDDPFGDF